MKKLYSLLAFGLLATGISAQTQLFKETFGAPTATITVNSYTGYDNTAPISFSAGTSGTDIRTSSASTTTDYTGASGKGNVMINSAAKYLLITGISTKNYENLSLQLGLKKGTTAANNELKIEVSNDGVSWTQLSYTRPTGSGTANWALVTPTGVIPETETLQIKFSGTNATEWRVDDIILTGNKKTVPCTAPEITSQPEDKTVAPGTSTNFSVTATGDALTYQWQSEYEGEWTNIPNDFSETAQQATLVIDEANEGMNGAKLRVIVKSGTCETISETATLTVDTTLASNNVNAAKINLVKNTVVANEIIFGQEAKVSVINMAGQVVKTADVKDNSRLDVSNLAKGTYIVTATVNGKAVSQKVIKK